LDEAIAEYRRLLVVYPSLGYEVIVLPKVNVPARTVFVLQTLAD
jgi:predicted ATPase